MPAAHGVAAPRKISAEEFVGRLAGRPSHTQYALLLGAGCSVSSGIPAAGALVADTWLPRLYGWRAKAGERFEDWVAEEFPGYDADAPALSYGPVMEALFPQKRDKQKEVERICSGRDPGFGCCVLAKLIEKAVSDFNVVLTTNFDDLLADALYLFTRSRPLVIPHAALASFMRPDFERPLVVKLHGDHQLEPLNTKDELEALSALVRARLQNLLQQRGLIVMGYAGNDNSVMTALEALPLDDTLDPGVWWVARSEPNERVSRWLDARNGAWVESSDFDQLMLLVQQRFELPHPEIYRWVKLRKGYFEAFGTLRTTVAKLAQSEPSAPALKQASADALKRIPDWWQVEMEARPLKESDRVAAAAIYREGLERLPNSPELLGTYAIFLKKERKDHDSAELVYKRAIEADPTDANNLGSYALFLDRDRADPEAAEDFYKRAIDADPTNSVNLVNYAMFLDTREAPDAAAAFFRTALDADPGSSYVLGNYARFLHDVRGEHDRAEELYERALAAEPDNAVNLASYALFLDEIRQAHDAAEDAHRRALELDPDNANRLGNYARHLIWNDQLAAAAERVERALLLAPDDDELSTELWFYLYANGPEARRQAALSAEKRLLTSGARSPGWDLGGNVARARQHGHPEAVWLPRLAAVIADEAPVETLDEWDAWKAA